MLRPTDFKDRRTQPCKQQQLPPVLPKTEEYQRCTSELEHPVDTKQELLDLEHRLQFVCLQEQDLELDESKT